LEVAKVYETNIENIEVPEDRVRKKFDKRKINNLAFSIQRIGQCQPGVCKRRDSDGKYSLVAGERRLRACAVARLPFRFTLLEETDPATILEIEIEENVNREDLTWQEEVEATDRLHRFREEQKKKKGLKQGVRQTAEEIGDSVGKTHEALDLVKWMEVPEVAQAKSKTEAKKIIKKLEAEVVRNVTLTRATEEASSSKARVETAPEKSEAKFIEVGGKKLDNEWILDCDRRVIGGKFEEKIEDFKDGSIQLVIFDPPWGVDRNAETNSQENVDDSPSIFLDNAENWLKILHRKMDENAHLYLFFGIIYHEFVYSTLENCGFEVDRIPIIWYKQGIHHQHNPSKWPGRSYEPIAFAHKGNKKLLTLGSPDVIITKGPTPSMKQSHPHAKHPDVYVELLKRSAFPGDTILDPMCGSGMFGVAAEMSREGKKLDWWMIEGKPHFRTLALSNVIKGYSDVCNREPIQKQPDLGVPEVPEDFRTLEPGSEMWTRYWREHPEKQEEMLEWKMSRGK